MGGDYRQALRLLPGAVAQLQNQITQAERKSGQVSAAFRYPMTAAQLAYAHYTRRLAFDDQLRNDRRYAMVSTDDMLVQRLRDAKAGRADDQELEALVGSVLNYFRSVGNLDASKGSDQWREIARALCIAEYEALERAYEDGMWIARITPEAGSVKTGGYRDVPLHPQVIEQGFADFINDTGQGPLFHNGIAPDSYVRKSKKISKQLASWLTESGRLAGGLAPNHAWRHRFKTQCIELGISDRIMDAIQGHAGRIAGDNYGDLTLKSKWDAICKLKSYDLSAVS